MIGNSLYKRREGEESRDNCRISGKETVFAEMRNSGGRVIWERIDEFVYGFVDCEVCIH